MTDTIEYSDFLKVEMRVGKVVAAAAPDWSHKLIEFQVDFGSEIGEKTILSGVKAWYSPEDFIGKNYVFVVNLAERKMGEGVSQGMMLMADEKEQPVIIPVSADVVPGTLIR